MDILHVVLSLWIPFIIVSVANVELPWSIQKASVANLIDGGKLQEETVCNLANVQIAPHSSISNTQNFHF